MKRTTVKLPDELDARLRLEARRRGITVSQLTREAIAAFLGDGQPRRLMAAGAGVGDGTMVADRIHELLKESGFGEDAWS
jgi:predicted transcriptional regulator